MAKTMAASLLDANTIGVLIVSQVDDEGHRAGQIEWQASPIEGAPKIRPGELAALLRASAARLDAMEGESND